MLPRPVAIIALWLAGTVLLWAAFNAEVYAVRLGLIAGATYAFVGAGYFLREVLPQVVQISAKGCVHKHEDHPSAVLPDHRRMHSFDQTGREKAEHLC